MPADSHPNRSPVFRIVTIASSGLGSFMMGLWGLKFGFGDGRVVASLGAGEGFGEIALLRSTPRTAGVVARTDVRLLTLGSQHFLVAVLGYTPSSQVATTAVTRLLERWDPGRGPGADGP